jgi:hypothetical protein
MSPDQALQQNEQQARAELEMCYLLSVDEIVAMMQWAQSQSSGSRESRPSTERLASEVRPHSGLRAG